VTISRRQVVAGAGVLAAGTASSLDFGGGVSSNRTPMTLLKVEPLRCTKCVGGTRELVDGMDSRAIRVVSAGSMPTRRA